MTRPCLGPRPAEKPGWTLPDGAWDTHFHVLGPQAAWNWLKAWFVKPEGGLRVATNIGLFALFLFAFKLLAAILASLTNKAVSRLKKTSDLLRSFLVNTVRKVVFVPGRLINFVVG